MDIRKLQRVIVDGLEDVKASDLIVFNTEHLSPLFERVVIASGNSNRQTKALAANVRDEVRAAGGEILSVEGEDNGEWIIVDCGAAVVHIMQPAIRQYYHLEEIWGGKAVRMKMAAPARGLPKASEGDSEDDDAPAARAPRSRSTAVTPRAAAPRTSARGASAREALNEAAARTAKKTPARKSSGPPDGAKPAAERAPARKATTAPSRSAESRPVARKAAPARKSGSPAARSSGSAAAPRRPAPARKPRSA